MKAIEKAILLILFFGVLFFTSCDLNLSPTNQLSSKKVKGSKALLKKATIGNYSMLGGAYGNLRTDSQVFQGDNLVWVKNSGSNFSNIYSYNHIVNNGKTRALWRHAYHAIYAINAVIEDIPDNTTDSELLELEGENLFIRAIFYYDLLRVFARPYSQDPKHNLGVVIKDSTGGNPLPKRSTVKECYNFVVNDLLKAASLMHIEKSDIYASKEAAWALLARMYLYMEKNDKAITYADKVINSGKYHLVPTNKLGSYFTMLPENNPGTIFAIKFTPDQNRGKGAIGSLQTKFGWAEMPISPSYLKLIYTNPNDARINWIRPVYALDANGNKIPDSSEPSGFKVKKRNGYSKYFNIKYTGQGGNPLLSSPVVIRLAEMYLIKAEAFAKLGKNKKALKMVNIIRKRAGLHGNQLYTINDLKGGLTALDIVLQERRLELAWEGQRSYILFNNNRPLDRSYNPHVGWAGPSIIRPTSKLIVLFIPESAITKNPNLVQNPK